MVQKHNTNHDTLENLLDKFVDPGSPISEYEYQILVSEIREFIQRKRYEMAKMRHKWNALAEEKEGGYLLAEKYGTLISHIESMIFGQEGQEDHHE